MKKLLNCVACGTALEWAVPQAIREDRDIVNQPHGATVFTSYGQYGSTFWDSRRRFIEVNICTECLYGAAERGDVIVGERIDHPTTKYVEWTREAE